MFCVDDFDDSIFVELRHFLNIHLHHVNEYGPEKSMFNMGLNTGLLLGYFKPNLCKITGPLQG